MCCGSKSYDTSYEMCCNNVIQRKIGQHPMCCGVITYDSLSNKCCPGNIVKPAC